MISDGEETGPAVRLLHARSGATHAACQRKRHAVKALQTAVLTLSNLLSDQLATKTPLTKPNSRQAEEQDCRHACICPSFQLLVKSRMQPSCWPVRSFSPILTSPALAFTPSYSHAIHSRPNNGRRAVDALRHRPRHGQRHSGWRQAYFWLWVSRIHLSLLA